jgi:hypothetical protein
MIFRKTPKDTTNKNYVPKGRYKKAKHTTGGEFEITKTKELYQGYYIEIYGGKYFAGQAPEEQGVELTKLQNGSIDFKTILPLVTTLAAGIFGRKLTKPEITKGAIKRYFIQDRKTNKIQEVDEPTYNAAKKELPNRVFAQVDWIVKGPAEDKMFGQYKYEGAESRNKKTIQDLEKQVPGISTFITDYKYLVQEPVIVDKQTLTSQTIVEEDPTIQLENSRKANFDTRK